MTTLRFPPDPDKKNVWRSMTAYKALEIFSNATGINTQNVTIVEAILCNLMHFCDRREYDFGSALKEATKLYKKETHGNPKTQ